MTEQTLIVVSNTSPLTNLAAIGRFDLLQKVLGHLHVSRAVAAELTAGGRNWPGALEVSRSPWIEVHTVQNRYTVDALRLELDAGEAETIALALEMQADLVLMDEQDGRPGPGHLPQRHQGLVHRPGVVLLPDRPQLGQRGPVVVCLRGARGVGQGRQGGAGTSHERMLVR